MSKHQVAWWLWAAGTVLIVLSWIDVVAPELGWLGFAVGLAGSVLGWGIRPPTAPAKQGDPRSSDGSKPNDR